MFHRLWNWNTAIFLYNGNTITTTTGRDIAFTLYDESSDTGTATSFTLTNAGTAPAFVINDTHTGVAGTFLDLRSGGASTLKVSEAGVISLAGNNAADITTLTGGADILSNLPAQTLLLLVAVLKLLAAVRRQQMQPVVH